MTQHTSAQDIIANAQAIRARLMGKQHFTNIAIERAREVARANAAEAALIEAREENERLRKEAQDAEIKANIERIKSTSELCKSLKFISTSAFASAKFNGKPDYFVSVKQAIDQQVETVLRRTIPEIIRAVVEEHGAKYTVAEILGEGRQRDLVRIRQACHYQAVKERPDLSRANISRRFNRDHTTIIHSCRKYARLNKLELPR